MYGYENDAPSTKMGGVFGLNAGTANLIKFEWINNAGKDGAEAEALDIQFSIEGSDRPLSYRQFPVTKAFGKDQEEITDPKAPEFQKALKEFNACITHILHTFIPIEDLKAALAKPIPNFKEYCKIIMALLPKDYDKIPLDIFLQYQWQIKGENKRTYLEIPKKMSYGRWLCKAVAPSEGSEWKETKHRDPSNDTPIALKYVDGEGNIHPFVRNGWYMLSNFAKEQRISESPENIEGDFSPDEQDTTQSGW